MAETTTTYRRMPGGGSRGKLARIWQSDDHLLLQARYPCAEEYRRFYFRDIQAVIVRKTAAGLVYNCLLSVALGISVLTALAADETYAPRVLVVIFMAALLINVMMGPTCQCHLKTAANLQWLSMVVRLRTARKFIAALRPLVAGAQEDISPQEIASRFAAAAVITRDKPADTQNGN